MIDSARSKAAAREGRRRPVRWRRGALSVFLIVYAVIVMIPMIWIFSLSLRRGKDVFSTSLIPASVHLDNYIKAWQKFGFTRLFANSIIVSVVSVLITVAIAALAGYAFSRLQFKGSGPMFYSILLGLMIPPAAVVVPLVWFFAKIHLYNNLLALILAYTAFGLPIAVLLLRGFFYSIPMELKEAATIDGCSELGAFFRIILPLCKPGVVTVTIFLLMTNWNEFLLALVLLRDQEKYTLPVGINIFVGQWSTPWELIAAGVIIVSVPIFLFYLAMQDQFERGLTAGAIKG
jgi:ABC-type glycerol-3-phosphate transport system permease component